MLSQIFRLFPYNKFILNELSSAWPGGPVFREIRSPPVNQLVDDYEQQQQQQFHQ